MPSHGYNATYGKMPTHGKNATYGKNAGSRSGNIIKTQKQRFFKPLLFCVNETHAIVAWGKKVAN